MIRLMMIAALLCLLLPAVQAHSAGKQTILNTGKPAKMTYPKIVIYTVSWCPHCRELKEYLTSNNIPFINRDVELDSTAMDHLTSIYKTFGVPVVVIGNDQEILKGFTRDEFEQAVRRVSAKKP